MVGTSGEGGGWEKTEHRLPEVLGRPSKNEHRKGFRTNYLQGQSLGEIDKIIRKVVTLFKN